MFRPPEYAALINPNINAFAFTNADAVGRYITGKMREMYIQSRLGPKDWSPIGEYKFKKPQ